MLQFQLQQAPMRLGIEEGVEPHQAPFGTLTKAENCCWSKTGLLEKRPGTMALDMTGVDGFSPTTGARIWTRGDELLITETNGRVWGLTSRGWAFRQHLSAIGFEWSTVSDTMAGVKAADSAIVGDRIVYAWVTGDPQSELAGGEVYLQVTDLDGKTLVDPRAITSTGNAVSRVRVVSNGTTFVVLYAATGELRSYVGTVGGTTTALQTDVNDPVIGKCTYNAFDACVIDSNFVVAYAKTGGGIKLASYSFATVPALQATDAVSTTTSTGISAISVDGSASDKLYVLFADAVSGTIRFGINDPTTLAVSMAGVTTVATQATMPDPTVGVVKVPAGGARLVWSYRTAKGILGTQSVTAAGALGGLVEKPFCRLLTRPFFADGAIDDELHVYVTNFVTAAGYNTAGSDTYLMSLATGREIGKVESFSGGRWFIGYSANVVTIRENRTFALLPFTGDAASGSAPWRQGLRGVLALSRDERPADMWRTVYVGPEIYTNSGVLSAYDGVTVVPTGFAHPAYLDTTATVATTGGGLAVGSYTYNTAPERRSAAGVLHRGPTGVPLTVAVNSPNNAVTVSISPVGLSTFYQPEQIAIYRTVVNGTILQRLAAPPTFMSPPNTAAASISVTDITSDTAAFLARKPALYTAGGELDDFQPVALSTIAVHQNRVWGIGGDGFTLWLSKDMVTNAGVAPGFHPSMTLLFTQKLTALASLDDKLVVFGEKAFWYVVGQGPAPNGDGSSYETIAVQSDVGCINPRSVVSVPDGVMFESERGLYLLTRGLELAWVGRPVKDEVAGADITSAVLVASRNEVRFTAGATVLVYNYVERQWTTAKYTVGGVYGAEIVDACVWQGHWTALTADGQVIQEADGGRDGDAWVPMTVETAWYAATGPLAYQSVRNFSFEGVARTAHSLTIEVGFDSSSTYPQTKTFEVTDVGPENYEISIGTRRKCRSIRFRISDAAPTGEGGTGEGMSLAMLGIEVGAKRGFAKKPSARTG